MPRNRINIPLALVNQIREKLNPRILYDIFIHIYGALDNLTELIDRERPLTFAKYQNWRVMMQSPAVPSVGTSLGVNIGVWTRIRLQANQKLVLTYCYIKSDTAATGAGTQVEWFRSQDQGVTEASITGAYTPELVAGSKLNERQQFVIRELFSGDWVRWKVVKGNGSTGVETALVGVIVQGVLT